MKKNVGNADQVVRYIVTAILVIAGYLYGTWWLYLIALVPLVTSITRVCPLYSALRVSTVRKR
ncbi:DUF2892 domain-containing protein [Candidatus Woesearchaeota archaeon]|nr:DUF2892 domain-containing protein [Candidatus Woesearchaeota archaeon]